MKVFACCREESFGGGLIIVAANTKEEAYNTALRTPGIYGNYPLDGYMELSELSANVTEPQVIKEGGYSE